MSYFQPILTFLLFLLAVGVSGCRNGKSNKRPRVLVFGILALFMVCWPPVAWLASQPLERWFARRAFPAGDGQAIVVLSSNILPPLPERPIPLPERDTYERCQYAAWLYKNWRRLPVLACGGRPTENREPFAATMRRILRSEGVDDSMIWTEEQSRSTHENATYGAEMLRAKGIRQVVLVTEAYHMLRAEKCFRKEGIAVIAAPCGFRTFDFALEEFLPGWRAIYHNERTLHEEVGLAWYWMRGWI